MDFSLAMWEENVVMIIPAFRFWIVKRTSSKSTRATFSEGVFFSEPEYRESTIKRSTPSLDISRSLL